MSDDFHPELDAWLAERSRELAAIIAACYPAPPPLTPEQIEDFRRMEAARQAQAVRDAGEPAELPDGWAEYWRTHRRRERTGDFSFIYRAIHNRTSDDRHNG